MTRSFIASKCHSEVYIEKRVTAGKEITKKIHYDVLIKVMHKRLVTSLEFYWKKSQEVIGFLDRYIMMLIGFVDEMEFHIWESEIEVAPMLVMSVLVWISLSNPYQSKFDKGDKKIQEFAKETERKGWKQFGGIAYTYSFALLSFMRKLVKLHFVHTVHRTETKY